MAYSLPTFNLFADVWRDTGGGYVVVDTIECNLAMGKRISWFNTAQGGLGDFAGLTPVLLCPPLTDVRDRSCGGVSDVIECPAGSGRWYAAEAVDDIGKGFSNEHRCVTLAKVGWFEPWLSAGFTAWPTPIP